MSGGLGSFSGRALSVWAEGLCGPRYRVAESAARFAEVLHLEVTVYGQRGLGGEGVQGGRSPGSTPNPGNAAAFFRLEMALGRLG